MEITWVFKSIDRRIVEDAVHSQVSENEIKNKMFQFECFMCVKWENNAAQISMSRAIRDICSSLVSILSSWSSWVGRMPVAQTHFVKITILNNHKIGL